MAIGFISLLIRNYVDYERDLLLYLNGFVKIEFFNHDTNVLKSDDFDLVLLKVYLKNKFGIRISISDDNISILDINKSIDNYLIIENYSLDQIAYNSRSSIEIIIRERFSKLQNSQNGLGYICDYDGYSEDYFGPFNEKFY